MKLKIRKQCCKPLVKRESSYISNIVSSFLKSQDKFIGDRIKQEIPKMLDSFVERYEKQRLEPHNPIGQMTDSTINSLRVLLCTCNVNEIVCWEGVQPWDEERLEQEYFEDLGCLDPESPNFNQAIEEAQESYDEAWNEQAHIGEGAIFNITTCEHCGSAYFDTILSIENDDNIFAKCCPDCIQQMIDIDPTISIDHEIWDDHRKLILQHSGNHDTQLVYRIVHDKYLNYEYKQTHYHRK